MVRVIIAAACISLAACTAPTPAHWRVADDRDVELVSRLSAFLQSSGVAPGDVDPFLCSDDGGTCCTETAGNWCCCSFTLGCRCGVKPP